MSTRLKVLCLHGFTSNGTVHAHQLRRITKALPEYDFIFPDGPHEVDISSQTDLSKPENQAWTDLVTSMGTSGHRAWWFSRDGNWQNGETGGFYGLEKSLDFIGNLLLEKGPVHAIWGFSQGACFSGMLCSLLQEKLANHPLRKHMPAQLPTPSAGVIFSGFRARFPQYDSVYEPGIDVPLLHVIGEKDSLVRSERSEALIKVCREANFLKHPGGHDIPKLDEDQGKIVEFLKSNVPLR
ncbi:hypothetical protein M409DRAFT_27573 [Zasmidium cellare ATCC 36951]|uniref:Serine hydrolase domain-containing protein n=1 Tax=Zasmidium cellare ATCC 36951 TaxID=1080233 RepID=A0A6A6C5B1_ZASCE|nr:uncharacterized protein M409DRAFT_27573 [Zasmidium cellare ATCC 36951]KAF2162195.1 hypothetical protein M409DRAFT_27573 [Zasmidium cellare ATCC 36951]